MKKRVRVAPSPTGYLHIGNIRAALINFLFAKKHDAEFILRIDDTDIARSKEEYTLAIKEDLAWLGITYDHTFKQTERINRYDEIRDKLIELGHLYPCYETEQELDVQRKMRLSYGKPPIYLPATPDQENRYKEEGRKPHYRFKLPQVEVSWHDLVKGDMHFAKQTMSDPVLVREDGSYLYTFTSVVDDVDFDITHIFRGQDHVSNTAVQICIFKTICELLGKPFNIEFGHTSFLLGAQGEPLSKRDNSIGIRHLRQDEIHPMTIMSFLAFAGTPFPIEPKHTLDELLSHFDVKHYGGASPKFSVDELKLLNAKLYHTAPYSWVKEHTTLNEDQWNVVRFNIAKRSDIGKWEHVLSPSFDSPHYDADYAKAILALLPDSLDWQTWFSAIKEHTGKKGKDAVLPIRKMLTDEEHGPEMNQLMRLLGKAQIQRRLSR